MKKIVAGSGGERKSQAAGQLRVLAVRVESAQHSVKASQGEGEGEGGGNGTRKWNLGKWIGPPLGCQGRCEDYEGQKDEQTGRLAD